MRPSPDCSPAVLVLPYQIWTQYLEGIPHHWGRQMGEGRQQSEKSQSSTRGHLLIAQHGKLCFVALCVKEILTSACTSVGRFVSDSWASCPSMLIARLVVNLPVLKLKSFSTNWLIDWLTVFGVIVTLPVACHPRSSHLLTVVPVGQMRVSSATWSGYRDAYIPAIPPPIDVPIKCTGRSVNSAPIISYRQTCLPLEYVVRWPTICWYGFATADKQLCNKMVRRNYKHVMTESFHGCCCWYTV